MTPQVVATTCLGVGHQIFHKRVFDYCIVDEASQITLPVCLGPIRMARTFVLVGDHHQLPPLVQNKEAQEGGLDVSLFKLLSDRQPGCVVNLEHQYRMCQEVMLLSNTLIYDGRLKCGNDAVAARTLHVPNPDGLLRYHDNDSSQTPSQCPSPSHASCWLSTILSPARKVVFANTDTILPLPTDTSHGARITNATEALLLTQTVLSLIAQGIPASEIGIITFYRSQLALLRQHLRHTPAERVEMHTADKFQGRDKEVVLLSCVRANANRNVGELLRDRRRVNVALTRARSKLVVFGSAETLGANELLARFLSVVDGRGWRVDLPVGAREAHPGFEREVLAVGSATQRTPAKRLDVAEAGAEREKEQEDAKEDKSERPVAGTTRSTHPEPIRRVGLKRPDKVGRVGQQTLLRSRPILQDIVNEVLGQDAGS